VKLTRERQIERALQILEPPPDERDICRQNIEFMLEDIETCRKNAHSLKHNCSKASARAWRGYQRALRHLRSAHDALAAAGWGPPIALKDVKRAIEASERYRNIGNYFHVLDRAETRAVDAARELLAQWRPNEWVTIVIGGRWWELAWTMLGENRDLRRHMIAHDRRSYFD
jgi:hypothetical protein